MVRGGGGDYVAVTSDLASEARDWSGHYGGIGSIGGVGGGVKGKAPW